MHFVWKVNNLILKSFAEEDVAMDFSRNTPEI